MSFIWILVAFLFGYFAKLATLPPMIGYLAAGFILHAVGVSPDPNLEALADLGITLMLFTIGLKVDLKQLMQAHLWKATLSHMSVWTVLLIPLMIIAATVSGSLFFDLTLYQSALVAFAFSFSSTVCAIKVLEDNAELKSKQGDLAIGVLIIQDLAAVIFLVIATGKVPSIWALALFGLIAVRPLIRYVFTSSGHGELIPLFGFLLALGGPELFELVKMKGDLGALIMGMLLAGLPKTTELYKSLISFKDLFLIGFFLSIGFTALPTFDMWFVAAGLSLLLPLKFVLFFFIFNFNERRGRTSFLSALLLTNYSEFGLIVASLSVDQEWLSQEWLVIIALSITLSLAFTSLIYKYAHRLYSHNKDFINSFQRTKSSTVDLSPMQGKQTLIVGMGRVGLGAYKELSINEGIPVAGIEVDPGRVQRFKEEGLCVVAGDADDIDFWEQVDVEHIKLIMLALPSINEMKNIIFQLKESGYQGKISAIAQYTDQQQELTELGADVAFNYYAEVGTGFAEESIKLIRE